MTRSRAEDLLGILQEHFNPREEGWLWLAVYYDSGEPGIVEQIEGAYDDPPATARRLARVIDGCGADRAYLALCRKEARPTEADRKLWRELGAQAGRDKLVDLVVFNHRQAWSMQREDTEAACASEG